MQKNTKYVDKGSRSLAFNVSVAERPKGKRRLKWVGRHFCECSYTLSPVTLSLVTLSRSLWKTLNMLTKKADLWLLTSSLLSSKKIELSKAFFIPCIKLAIPRTPIVQPLFLNPQSSVYFAKFSQGWIALSYLWRSDQLLLHSDMFMCLNFDT
jgi:hypothetical protein